MMTPLRIAFPYKAAVSSYDPLKIHRAPEYIFLENIYSPLIEISPSTGELIGGIAESMEWHGEELHLKIRTNLKTIDGVPITAADAAFSLKRLLVVSGNTHGNFGDLLCGSDIHSVDEACQGLRVDGNDLILTVRPGNKTFLVPMLAAIDFAVIPQSSVDPKSLKIIDYRNTSGPYFVAEDNLDGNIVLQANPSHYHYSSRMPQKVVFVPSGLDGSSESLERFKRDEVDLISTVDSSSPSDVINFAKENDGALHTTMNIRQSAVLFTDHGMQQFSQSQRLALGKTLKRVFREVYLKKPGFEATDQFFPSFGYGFLTETQKSTIQSQFSSSPEATSGEGVLLSVSRLNNFLEFKRSIEHALPGIKVQEGRNPYLMPPDDQSELPHLYMFQTDVAFLEDVGLITYSISAGHFGLPKEQGRVWLEKYMSMPNKDVRHEMLRQLHFQSLEQAYLLPLASMPFVAFARKPWNIELSQMFANNPLWLIKNR